MKFQGDIASINVGDVAQNLSANRKSGVLTIRLAGQLRWITFQDGKIVCYNDDAGFSIVEWIGDKQLVDPEIFDKALKRYKRTRRKGLGEILDELGGMPLATYRKNVLYFVNDVLCETFSYRQGTFEFVEKARDDRAFNREVSDAGLQLQAGEVLMEAARRMDEWEAIRKSLPSENDIYRVEPSQKERLLQEFENDEVASLAVENLDGTRSIGEVMALIPTGRFEAARAIASLVSSKIARPVDGTELVEQVDQTDTPAHRARAMVRLKAALEREPGNRVLLRKLSELCIADGRPEESAVYHKLLAQQLREADDEEGAEKELRVSLELNPKDIGTWQKLYDLVESRADRKEILNFGTRFAKVLRAMGLDELARDHLSKMLERFPQALKLRFEYADCLFALGDRSRAVEHLLELARTQLQKGRDGDAERTLAKVIEYDNQHKQAREIFEQIRSGALERQRERRRVLIRTIAACGIAAILCFFLGYDYYVRREFALTVRQVLAEGLIEKGEYDRAARRLQAVQDRYPLSILSLLEAKQYIEGLEEGSLRNTSFPSSPRPGLSGDPKSAPAPIRPGD